MDKNQIEPKPDLLPAEEYIPQIMSLINNDDETNAALCLELIGVCTNHTFLTGIVVGICLCSKNQENRNRAYGIIENKLSEWAFLQTRIKKRLDQNMTYLDLHHFAASNPKIDYCGFIFICRAFLDSGKSNLSWSLFDLKPSRLSNAHFFKDFGLNTLYLAIQNDKNDLRFAEIFTHFKIKRVHFKIQNGYFPTHFMQLSTVKYCYFDSERRGEANDENPSVKDKFNTIDIANLADNLGKLTHLFSLYFRNLNIKDCLNLGRLTQIKGIELHNCIFSDMSFLKNMPLLTRLALTGLSLKEFPSVIESLHNLTYLQVYRNKIARIDIDFKQLPKLRNLLISEEGLDYISDSFQDCSELRSVSFECKDKIFKLPQSLIDKGFS